MEGFKTVKPEEFECTPFQMVGKDWMLITAEKAGQINSMTAAWGGMGVMWGKNAVFAVIRKSRYTKEFVDQSDHFSLTFFDRRKYAKMLNYMGTVSGRDADKIKECGLTVEHCEGIPYYQEASTVILCKKMCCQPIVPENFVAEDIDSRWYSDKDYHDLYIGEIMQILKR